MCAYEKIKIDTENNEVTTAPNATVAEIATLMVTDIVVKNAKGEILANDAKLATGCVINDIYTVSVLGDVNGDSGVDTADLLAIQKQLLKISNIDGNEKIRGQKFTFIL